MSTTSQETMAPAATAAADAPPAAAQRRGPGQGIWPRALLIVGLAAAGLAVAALLLWLSLIQGVNNAHTSAMARAAADDYAGFFNARIATLEAQMAAAAGLPMTVAAVTSSDPAQQQEAGALLTKVIPYADRVDVIPLGQAKLDRNARVPISYAALTVIQRAETEPFVGPEGARLGNRNTELYVARPIFDSGGAVAGVLFAALSADFLLQPLETFAAKQKSQGQLTLQQTFEGMEPVALLQWGQPGTEHRGTLTRTLSAPHLSLVLDPNRAAVAPLSHVGQLLTAMAAAAGLLLAGVLFAFSDLARSLSRDAEALLAQVGDTLAGRRRQPQRYRLALFGDLAARIGRLGQPLAQPAAAGNGAATPAAPPPDDAGGDPGSHTVDEEPGDGALATTAAGAASMDDFLDVRDDNFGIEVSEDTSPMAMGLQLEPEIFRAYDIRGITTTNLTEDVVYWIGRAFAAEAADRGETKVAVGRDGRHSSTPLRDALARGLTEGGASVLDIGQVPTPVLYFATHVLDTRSGIMITGSHNPPEYNGLKMVIAGETLAEERIQALRARIEENRLPEGHGDIDSVDVGERYLARVTDDVVVAQPLKVVVDCGNGVAGTLAPALLERLGCEVTPLYCDVDGDFPNHHPDPAEPANLEDLVTVVSAEQADIGLAFDGDGDRLGVVTGSGEIIWPDKLLMLYAQDIVGRNPGADIIYDVKCSRHLNSLISDLGGRPIMWKTGHSHVKAKLKETGALLAGEFSGHICFGERWYGFDDALYSAARLLEILGSTESTADELFAQFPVTCSTPELKIQTTEQAKFEIIQRLAREGDFGDGTITTIDGLRVDYPDGWGLIRPSNTSPVLSLRFEAESPEALSRIEDLFQAQLSAIDSALRFR